MAGEVFYLISIWALPALIAITFHEAAHAYAAHALGDHTAWWLGRASLNPLRHIDPFGTVLLPGLLLLSGAPFLFGYAKPVPIDARALRRPRRDLALVAAAGPAMNLALAVVAALAFHMVGYLPATSAQWLAENLKNALIINVVLALFNLIPIPPLDGGRIAVSVLPRALANPLSNLEPYGFLIVLGLFVVLPLLGSHTGHDLGAASHLLASSADATIGGILRLTGNG